MVEDGEVALRPEARYLEWYRAIPAKRRAEIEAMWGPPPGKTMVHIDRNGQRSIVIPRLEIGNIIVAPHPMWGYYENEKVLMSKDALPPHHQYLAFFLYMQKEWKADAWVSLFHLPMIISV
jgi:cobaltochelatase CobN